MKVKMIKSTKGAEDGITVKTYDAGKEYDIVEKLAKIFVNSLQVAVFIQDEPVTKGIVSAPENKSVDNDTISKKRK